jgi:hypothetical protein
LVRLFRRAFPIEGQFDCPCSPGGILEAGLIAVNGTDIPKEQLIPVVTSFKAVKQDTGDLKTYAGTIEMLDYMGQKPILLYCKVHLKSCPADNKTFIFYELSPQPLSHTIWQSLDQLWLEFIN